MLLLSQHAVGGKKWEDIARNVEREAAVCDEAGVVCLRGSLGQRLLAGGPAQDLGMENSSEKESVVLSPARAHSDAGMSPGLPHQGQIAMERQQQQQHLSPENNKRPPGLPHNQTVNHQTIPVRLPSGSASDES